MVAPTQAPIGRLAILGCIFTKGATWGTEQSVATGKAVLATNYGAGDTKPAQYFSHGAGLKFQQVEYLLDVKGHFEVKFDYRYDGAGPLMLSAIMGSDTSPAVIDTSAYTHTLTWDDYNTAIGTFAMWFGNTNGTLQVLNSCKISSFTLEAKSNGALHCTVKGLGNRVDISPAATTTNTAGILTTLLGAIGADEIKQGCMFWHARTLASQNAGFLRIRKVTGSEGNCTSADDVYLSDWKMTIDRKLKQPDSQAKEMGEPYEDGQPHFKIDGTIPGFEGNPSDLAGVSYQLIQDLQASFNGSPVEYKGDFYFESVALAGAATAKYSQRHLLPSLAIKMPNPTISSMGMASTKIECTGMKAAAAPNGSDWTALTNPLTVKVVNKRATAYT